MSKEKFDYFIKTENNNCEVIIGLEVHAQVISNSKLFSGSSTKFGGKPNTQVSLVDSAFPGMLPVINKYCIEQDIKTGLGLNAKLNMYDVIEVISKGAAQSWQMENRYKTMIEDNFD